MRAVLLLALVLLISGAVVAPALADVTKQLAVQGVLKTSAGVALSGSRQITFAIYDVQTGGTPIKSGIQKTVIADTNGLFYTLLDATDLSDLNFDTNYWLNITVVGAGGLPTQSMDQRQLLTPAPYALALPGLVSVGGKIGIGTAIPQAKLDVNGTGYFADNLTIAGGNSLCLGGVCQSSWPSPITAWNQSGSSLYLANHTWKVGISTNSPSEKLNVNGSLRVDNATGSAVLFVNATSGNVGIGTTTPSEKLEVAGNVKVEGDLKLTGSIYLLPSEGMLIGGMSIKQTPLAAPVPTVEDLSGGTLEIGNEYRYAVTAIFLGGESIGGVTTPFKIGSGRRSLNISWAPVTNSLGQLASSYKVYGRNGTTLHRIGTTTANTWFVDNNSVTPTTPLPSGEAFTNIDNAGVITAASLQSSFANISDANITNALYANKLDTTLITAGGSTGTANKLTISGGVDSTLWAKSDYSYRKKIIINNNNSGNLNNYQVKVVLNTRSLINSGKMRADCKDMRFYENQTLLANYWVNEKTCNTGATEIWINMSVLKVGQNAIHVYYGKPGETATLSNGDNTFLFFDDFNDNNFDTSKWTFGTLGGGTNAEAGGELELHIWHGPRWAQVTSVKTFAGSIVFEADIRFNYTNPVDIVITAFYTGTKTTYPTTCYAYNTLAPITGTGTVNLVQEKPKVGFNFAADYAGSRVKTDPGYNYQAYHRHKIVYNDTGLTSTSTFKFYMDDVLFRNQTGRLTDASRAYLTASIGSGYGDSATGDRQNYGRYDNAFVRAYADVEPSAQVMPEEDTSRYYNSVSVNTTTGGVNIEGSLRLAGLGRFCIYAEQCPSDWTDFGLGAISIVWGTCPFDRCQARICCSG